MPIPEAAQSREKAIVSRLAAIEGAMQSQLAQAARMGRIGRWLLLLGLLPLAAWLALAPMASAVVANAHVKVDLDRRPVQHMEGGTVREVMVRDGQQVEAGQPLLAIDDRALRAQLQNLTDSQQLWQQEVDSVAQQLGLPVAPQAGGSPALSAATRLAARHAGDTG